MDEMKQYLRILRLLRNAEDAILDAGEALPVGLDPMTVEPTEEHVRRASNLMQRVLNGSCDGIAEEKLMASLSAAFFRKKPGAMTDDLLEEARKKAREQRARQRQAKASDDENGKKSSTP